MNANDRTIPDTFEDYLDRYTGDDDVSRQRLLAEHGDEIREMHARELLGQQQHPAPADMPPCPPWCTLPPGHGYDSLDDVDLDAGLVTLSRCHSTEYADPGISGCLSQEERLRAGQVTLGEVVIITGPDLEEIAADEARKRAAELLNLADRLDRIVGAQQ